MIIILLVFVIFVLYFLILMSRFLERFCISRISRSRCFFVCFCCFIFIVFVCDRLCVFCNFMFKFNFVDLVFFVCFDSLSIFFLSLMVCSSNLFRSVVRFFLVFSNDLILCEFVFCVFVCFINNLLLVVVL